MSVEVTDMTGDYECDIMPFDGIIEAVAENHLMWSKMRDHYRSIILELEAELEVAKDAIASYEVMFSEMETQMPFRAAQVCNDVT